MNTKLKKRQRSDYLHASRLSFWMTNLMHDNSLLPLLRNPYKALQTAGLKPGQKVLEVGCGPGFFTIPAAKIVGKEGLIYAIDVNPRAVKKVEEKMRKYGINNISPILGNAAHSGLPDESIDLAFVFGLRYIADGLGNLISEICRILKVRGVLSFEKTTGSADKLIEEVKRVGFVQTDRKGRVFVFEKR